MAPNWDSNILSLIKEQTVGVFVNIAGGGKQMSKNNCIQVLFLLLHLASAEPTWAHGIGLDGSSNLIHQGLIFKKCS